MIEGVVLDSGNNCRNCSDRTVWFPEAVRTLPVPVSLGLQNLKQARDGIGFCGTKETTDTQANFLTLFNSDYAKVAALDKRVTELCGFQYTYPITSQTYHRGIYADVLAPLAQRRIRS
jgi:adenylosuccinate lyase